MQAFAQAATSLANDETAVANAQTQVDGAQTALTNAQQGLTTTQNQLTTDSGAILPPLLQLQTTVNAAVTFLQPAPATPPAPAA